MKKLFVLALFCLTVINVSAQTKMKVYDESINPDVQITEAIAKAADNSKFVVAQLGGNWCKWCIRFARFIDNDSDLKKLVNDNFEFIHVNYNPRNPEANTDVESTKAALKRLGNPVRFGFPVLVVIDNEGNILHIQDSSFLESGEGYDKEKVTRFFKAWTPSAVNSSKM